MARFVKASRSAVTSALSCQKRKLVLTEAVDDGVPVVLLALHGHAGRLHSAFGRRHDHVRRAARPLGQVRPGLGRAHLPAGSDALLGDNQLTGAAADRGRRRRRGRHGEERRLRLGDGGVGKRGMLLLYLLNLLGMMSLLLGVLLRGLSLLLLLLLHHVILILPVLL